MSDLASMAQAVDFIEARLRDPIGVGDVAAAVAYSLYHFCRTFKASTHFTPYDYLMRRRVAEAARELLDGDRKIIDIALDYQFNAPETFSRAFKRVLGMQPNQWRKQGQAGYRQSMPRLTLAHLEHLQRGAPWHPAIVERPALTLVGVMTLGDGAAAWEWLHRESISGGGDFYEWTGFAPGNPNPAILAAMAVEERAVEAMTAGVLVVKRLPACAYLCVTHRGAAQDLALTLDYVYHAWLPQSGYGPTGTWYLEHFSSVPRRPTSGAWEVYLPVTRTERDAPTESSAAR